jgi:DNA-directed RNA polymerase sigma subunit (sigma70/sigma32)
MALPAMPRDAPINRQSRPFARIDSRFLEEVTWNIRATCTACRSDNNHRTEKAGDALCDAITWALPQSGSRPRVPRPDPRHAVYLDAVSESGDGYVEAYLGEVSKFPALEPDEEATLVEAVREGDEAARRRLIESYLCLVVDIARDYEGQGLRLLDLIQDGNLGLARAVGSYDEGDFSEYAAWCIRQSITTGIQAFRELL